MSTPIKGQQDFGAGLIYVALGGIAAYIGSGYRMGTGSNMGAGYFPMVLSVLLIALGVACVVRSFLRKGEPIGAVAWKPLILILLATVLFGALLEPLGLSLALVVLMLVSAAASHKFRLEWKAMAGMVVIALACFLVFVQLLGVPLPRNPWFGL